MEHVSCFCRTKPAFAERREKANQRVERSLHYMRCSPAFLACLACRVLLRKEEYSPVRVFQ